VPNGCEEKKVSLLGSINTAISGRDTSKETEAEGENCARAKEAEMPNDNVPVEFVSKDSHGMVFRIPIDAGIPGQVYKTGKLINWRPHQPGAAKSLIAKGLKPIPVDVGGTAVKVPSANVENTDPPSTEDPQLNATRAASTWAHLPNESPSTQELPPFTPYHKTARQIIGVPVFGVKGDVIGVVEIINPVGKEYFSRTDKEFLVSIASHLAVEIDGKQHITSILEMCRKQVAARHSNVTEENEHEKTRRSWWSLNMFGIGSTD